MTEFQLTKDRNIHIIGGGGVGMSALGMLLLHAGFQVSASDKNGGKYLQKLGAAGAKTWTGSDTQRIPSQSVVFYSSAIPESDTERAWAESQKMDIYSRHILLKFISSRYYTIAVSGTHGKTTTTGWIAYLLEKAGFDPCAIVGGTLVQWDSNIRMGKGLLKGSPILVIEADESDESFLHINSRETIITNIELDHVDNYGSLEQVQIEFSRFVENCQFNGGVFFPSFEVQHLLNPVMNDYNKIVNITSNIIIDESWQALVYKTSEGEKSFNTGLSGIHNLWNAFAVLTFGIYHEISNEIIAEALLEYRGVERRMQILGNYSINGHLVRIIDDYAHHPTEIKMVLDTLKKSNRPRIVIWEPHRISRLLHFNKEFREVFQKNPGFDNLVLLNVFDAAGEKQMPEFSSFPDEWEIWISQTADIIGYPDDAENLLKYIKEKNSDMDVVFLGAGNSSEYAHNFSDYCKQL